MGLGLLEVGSLHDSMTDLCIRAFAAQLLVLAAPLPAGSDISMLRHMSHGQYF